MAKRFVDKEHLAWVRQQPCLIKQAGFYSCKGVVQAHHLLKPYTGARGMSLRSGDQNVISLCVHHHSELHTKYGSEKAFFKNFGLPENYGKEMAYKLYEKSKFYRELDDDLPF
tara:strand:- start:80 stop:418 length:339 start_codon:yes stop_codon:yes gene_type:complete